MGGLGDILNVDCVGSRGGSAEGEFLATLQLPFDVFAQDISTHMRPIAAQIVDEPSALPAGDQKFISVL